MAKMIEQEDTAEATTAWTQKLPAPITYPFKWTEYATAADMREAGDGLSDEEQLKARNNARKNNARQKAYALAMAEAGYEKQTAENNDVVRLRDMFKTLMTSKRYSETEARAKASEVLGVEWPTE